MGAGSVRPRADGPQADASDTETVRSCRSGAEPHATIVPRVGCTDDSAMAYSDSDGAQRIDASAPIRPARAMPEKSEAISEGRSGSPPRSRREGASASRSELVRLELELRALAAVPLEDGAGPIRALTFMGRYRDGCLAIPTEVLAPHARQHTKTGRALYALLMAQRPIEVADGLALLRSVVSTADPACPALFPEAAEDVRAALSLRAAFRPTDARPDGAGENERRREGEEGARRHHQPASGAETAPPDVDKRSRIRLADLVEEGFVRFVDDILRGVEEGVRSNGCEGRIAGARVREEGEGAQPLGERLSRNAPSDDTPEERLVRALGPVAERMGAAETFSAILEAAVPDASARADRLIRMAASLLLESCGGSDHVEALIAALVEDPFGEKRSDVPLDERDKKE